MKGNQLTYCILLAAVMLAVPMRAQTIHPFGLEQIMAVSEDDMSGTARFIAMAGAMTAIGGDPTAVKQNPAGLGIYRHGQLSLTGDGSFRRYFQSGFQPVDPWRNLWHLAQISYAFALTHPERIAGIVSNNIMISYVRKADIRRTFMLNDYNQRPASATDWIETVYDESIDRHDADVHFAQNISNRFYWGVGMTLEWINARQTIDRWEYTPYDRRGERREYDLKSTALGRSVGWGASAGVLVHPIQMLRIGLSIESPLVGRMRETDYFVEKLTYPDAPGKNLVYESPDAIGSWKMLTPLKASAGVGLQWKNHGLLSLQYDLQYHKLAGVSHMARAGLEVAMTNHWMLQAGYNFSTLFTRHRVSVGLHYMGNWLRVGVAYAHSWSSGSVIDELYLTEQGIYKLRENKLVFTFQWNS